MTSGNLKKLIRALLIQLVGCTLCSDNVGTLSSGNGCTHSSDNGGTGHLSEVTNCKLKKLIQPVLIQLVGRTLQFDNGDKLCSDNSGTLSTSKGGNLCSDNGGTGCLSKVTNCKLKKLVQPVLMQLVCCSLHSNNSSFLSSDNVGTGHLS